MAARIKLAATKADAGKDGKPKKLTLSTDRELDYLLYSIALQRGCSKQDLCLKFIRDGVERSGAKEGLRAAYAMLTGKAEAAA